MYSVRGFVIRETISGAMPGRSPGPGETENTIVFPASPLPPRKQSRLERCLSLPPSSLPVSPRTVQMFPPWPFLCPQPSSVSKKSCCRRCFFNGWYGRAAKAVVSGVAAGCVHSPGLEWVSISTPRIQEVQPQPGVARGPSNSRLTSWHPSTKAHAKERFIFSFKLAFSRRAQGQLLVRNRTPQDHSVLPGAQICVASPLGTFHPLLFSFPPPPHGMATMSFSIIMSIHSFKIHFP